MNINSYFFLTVKVSRATDYDEGYTMINHQTQTQLNCKCWEKGLVKGKTWDDDALYLHSVSFKRKELEERCKLNNVETQNRVHIPTAKDRERIR